MIPALHGWGNEPLQPGLPGRHAAGNLFLQLDAEGLDVFPPGLREHDPNGVRLKINPAIGAA